MTRNALTVLRHRYLKKNVRGRVIESPRQMFDRVAKNIASAERNFDGEVERLRREFFHLLSSLRFLPNSPTLMNAGRDLQQLSACFVLPVEDRLESIFEAVKDQAIIQQSGGGCIAADARVWTTFCGIEPIETLFNRAVRDGRQGERIGSGTAYEVRDLDIRTVSTDPRTGRSAVRRVTHIWRFEVPSEDQVTVRTREGTVIQTSAWHPFPVVRGVGLVEVRADELVPGDILLTPERPDDFWPYDKETEVAGLPLDCDLAWLAGFTLGDGSFGYVPSLGQYRVRWFSGEEDVLERVREVLRTRGIHVSIQRDKRGLWIVSTLSQPFVHALLAVCGLEKFGPKETQIRVPEAIAKSPLRVIRAFIAGLLDSDGYVAGDGSPSYSTVSEALAEDLAAMLSLLGYHASVRRKPARGRGKLPIYEVQFCRLPQVNALASDLGPSLVSQRRRERLQTTSRRQLALRLPLALWRDRLARLGLVRQRGDHRLGPGPLARELNAWSCNDAGRCSRAERDAIAAGAEIADPNLARLLRRIATSGQEVARVERSSVPKLFYDLTVEEWNTYAAGRSGLALVHNTGFSFSHLRPKNDRVMTTSGVASGPVSFIRIFNMSTDVIKQGGARRGANMAILRVDHPDIIEFITVKEDPVELTNFNLSVGVTDDFMERARRGRTYPLIHPRNGKTVGRLSAAKVLDLIVRAAWKTGEPGMIFLDRINRDHPVPALGAIEATNPCGEQPLLPYESCNLGSINLTKMIRAGRKRAVDFDLLEETVRLTVRFLDNVIEVNRYPLPAIEEMTKKTRKIGLGGMGLADALISLSIPYDSDEALAFAEDLMRRINKAAREASLDLGAERGVFPAFEKSVFAQMRPPLRFRNSTRTTIAPTGTLSVIAGCSSGIEPLYGVAYVRNVLGGIRLPEVHPEFVRLARRHRFYSERLIRQVAAAGSIAGLTAIPKEIRRLFVTAHDIAPEFHVQMQAAFQRHTDNAVSKTINFRTEASPQEVRRAFLLAYEEGCKGITIYRSGSRAQQALACTQTEYC